MKLTPYLASVEDGTACLWLYQVNEFVNSTENLVVCSMRSFDTLDSCVSMVYNVATSSSGVQLVDVKTDDLDVDITKCPFPWKLCVGFYHVPGERIRILK